MFHENIETIKYTGEKEPYSRSNVQRRLAEISKKELVEEPRKRPGAKELMPWDPMILSKIGYSRRSDIPDGR